MAENIDPKDPNNQILEFDLREHKWLINGKWYYLLSKLPPRRYVEYLKLLPEVFFNTTFAGLYETCQKSWQYATSGNDLLGSLHAIAETNYNQLSAIVDFDKKEYPKVYEFCAVIMAREGEVVKDIDENLILDKIDDFMNSEYSHDSFFFLATHSVPHFSEVYSKLQENLNQEIKKVL